MRKLVLSVAVGALAVSGIALADNPNWSAEKKAQVAANRCTDAGRGNGDELSVTSPWGSVCFDELPSDDQGINIDAKDPSVIGPFSFSTDPGNSVK